MKRRATSSKDDNTPQPQRKRQKLNDVPKRKRKSTVRNYDTRVVDVTGSECDFVEIKEKGLHLEYYPHFIAKAESTEILETMERLVEYQSAEESSVLVFGKRHLLKRKQTAFGDPGTSYKFCGKEVRAKEWSKCAVLLDIKDRIHKHLARDRNERNDEEFVLRNTFNFVLLNRYNDGTEKMGFHRDNEPDIKSDSSIAAMSFGAERDIIFKHQDIIAHRKTRPLVNEDGGMGVKIVKIKLHHGSLLIMRPPTNKEWYHEIPKRAKIKEVRVSLTFRNMVVNLAPK